MAMENTNRQMIEGLTTKIDGIDKKIDRLEEALVGGKFEEGFIPETRRRITDLEEKVLLIDKIESLERDLKDSQEQLKSTKENFDAFIQEHNRYQIKMMLKLLGAAGAGGGVVGGVATAFGG